MGVADGGIYEIKKKLSYMEKEEKSDEKECLLCKKKITSYCKSHTILQFILKQVSNNGHLSTGVTTLRIPILQDFYGVGNALVFRCICDECDNTKFQLYENPDKYQADLSQEMIKQIVLKNNLRMLDKSKHDFNLIVKNYDKTIILYLGARINNIALDVRDYADMVIKNNKINYYVIDDFMLPYMTPLAFQGILNLLIDFDGKVVNNLYNLDPNYRLQNLHAIVFPNNGTTHICYL